ncbi:hypothetical protein J1605_002340 [Eschrichtius robustus]|uniref:Mucin-5B n=1 Tax=Eschrichtius robustus TaxID=9764 RepID=A0AB34HTM9_ESCRO|nr:hypothetical protein J1605_002340 [Eschrichtius robustus]
MGAQSGCRALAWALVVLPLVQKAETQSGTEQSWASQEATVNAQRVTFIPPITGFPTMSSPNAAHGGRVCSTWGDFHYKTFDGDIFRFPGLCNYVFSAHCGAAYEDFNLQLRRGLVGSRPTVTHIILKTQGLVLEVSNGSILVNGRREELPYSRAGLLVEESSAYVKVNIRLMLTFTWNGEDSALLELDPRYANQTCGLCGDFNGLPAISEFYAHNARLTPLQFGNLQKLDGPTEQCQDPLPSPADNCTDGEGICRQTLLGPAFAQCHRLVDAEVYVATCTQDLCRCPTCPCATFAEYSRQCAHAGGQPQSWRGPDLCPQTCPLNMQHQECGSPCADTCSNPERSQLCEDHCVDGCFCPLGTVLDDVTHSGCLPLRQCPCTHGGRPYAPGASFTTSCSSCTCSGGLWQCQDLPCPGICSVQGGSHISTYDEKLYDVHGDCSYVLTKICAGNALTVLAELRRCGLTDNENCLRAVMLTLSGGDTAIQIQANGGVFVNSIYTQLPVSVANITVFRPSSFFILVQTGLGLQLQVQLVPLMQVFLRLDPSYQGQMCGLCGNFNRNQADDFRTISGVVEGTAAAFANTWKTQAACPNVKNGFEDPCSLSVENENYAQHWCSLLTDPAGAFSSCHSVINPGPFHSNCMFDTCSCEKSEDCMCAALSSYVRACAARGVLLGGWRDGVCNKYVSSCPKTQSYAYVVDSCQPTCRSLSQADVTCDVAFVPVDGCTCPPGTFLDDTGDCVPAEACPCYSRGSVLAPGEVLHDNGVVCSCASGKLSCLGAVEESTGCVAPMLFLDCSNASADTPGAECVQSCHVLDVDCFSTRCVSGCVCPAGLLADGSGGCVAEEDCPCLHNEATYKPGETIRIDCNTCTCRGRRWECSRRPCLGTCVAYGDGHFITFDGERYSFEGSCEYTLAQDFCAGNNASNGSFRIVTENVPCGTTGVTCSKAIKIFLENYELILHEGSYKVVQRGPGGDLPYKIRYMGIYLAVETRSGMVVSWDRKTSVFIRLHQEYKGRVCGLCGNFDDNALNDFTTRSQSVVGGALEFGNSWKFSPSCPDAQAPKDPCAANPYRKPWAQKQCSIVNSATFRACRSQVDSTRYYEACVSDACACDSGGDRECFCTAVAAYAQACHEAGVCVSWRTPDICPLFCDYYNPQGECEWHYQPCGAPCLRTCRNPSGHCLMDLPGLEGCYPKCPPSKPFFNEDEMKCVAQCGGCYDEDGNYHDAGTRVPTAENCQSCDCTSGGLQCTYSPAACTCTYEGRTYAYGDVIYNTTDGLGACLIAICRDNGTIVRKAEECPGTPSPTPFTFTSTAAPPSTTGAVPTPSTVCVQERCRWSDWYDSGRPELGTGGGDFETFENLRQRGYRFCPAPAHVECRAQQFPDMPLEKLGQKVECGQARGLTCLNSEQNPPLCHNYELRVLCCDYVPCSTSPAPGTSQRPSSQPLPTSTQTTPTRGTTLLSMAPSASQTPSAKPASTVTRVGSSSVVPATTTCEPRCQWTEWFDEDYPKSEEAGGDVESYDKIRRAGGAVCEQPQGIECQAENFPDVRLEELNQRVHCDVSFGLVCRNDEQVGLFKMCYNYKIRVLCCGYGHCGEPTSPTATVTSSTVTATTVATSTATIATTSTATAPTATASTATATTAATSTAPTATASTATAPTATASTATATTVATSTAPTATTSTVTAPMATTSTATTVATSTATTAATSTATAPTPIAPMSPTATATVTTAATSTAAIATAATTAATAPTSPTASSTTTAVSPATQPRTRPGSTGVTRSPASSATPAPSLSTGLTAQVTSSRPSHTGTLPVSATSVLPTHTASRGPTPASVMTQTSTSQPLTGTAVGKTGTTSTGPLSTSHPETRMPGTPVSTGTTTCEPRCQWTEWFDEDYPKSEEAGGDVESYDKIRRAGGAVCEQPQGIECQAENFPDVRLEELNQRVHCDVSFGLVCRNDEQVGLFKMCYNYKIRVLCCGHHCHHIHCHCPHCHRIHCYSHHCGHRYSPHCHRIHCHCIYCHCIHCCSHHCGHLYSPHCHRIHCHSPHCHRIHCYSHHCGHLYSPHCGHLYSPHCHCIHCHSPHCHRIHCYSPHRGHLYRPHCHRIHCHSPHYHCIHCHSHHCGHLYSPHCHHIHCHSPYGHHLHSNHCGHLYSHHCSHLHCHSPHPHSPHVPHCHCHSHHCHNLHCYSHHCSHLHCCHCHSGHLCCHSPHVPHCLQHHHRCVTSHAAQDTAREHRGDQVPRQQCHTSTFPFHGTDSPTSRGPTPASVMTQTSTSQPLTGTAVGKTGTTSTGPLSTSHPETSMPGTPVSTGTTTCEPRCQWTEWFDEDYPKSEEAGGDVESYDKIRRAGGAVCEQPQGIECQAENFPDVRLEELNQRVHCDVSFGLVCRNDEQVGLFKMCYNYKIRVLCCGYGHCGEPTSPTATATASTVTARTATTSTATATTVATSTATAATTSTATAPTATASTSTVTTVATSTATTATASTATAPTATASTATVTTVATSTAPTATTSTATAPTATASTATAPTAATSTATAPTPMASTSPTTTATAPTATTSTARVTTAATSTAAIATAATSAATAPTSPTASSTTTTVPPATQPTTWPGSTGVTRSPTSSATPASSLSTGLTARVTSSPSHTGTLPVSATGSLTSPPGSTEPTVPRRATSVLPTHTASRGPTPTSVTMETSTSQLLTGTAVGTTGTTSTGPPSTSHPETSMPGIPVSTATTGATTSQGTTSCQPRCQWTEWFDVDFPTSGVRGGDMETYDNIRAAGGKMCQQPQKIECRAESYPEVSIDQIGQVLSCSLEVGLVCRNEDQRGQFTMCFNYNIRVYCCDDVRHCPTTATPYLTSTTLPATSSSTATVPWPSTSATTQTQPTSTAPPATGRSTATVPSPSISAVTQTGAPTTAPPTAHIHETTFGTTLLPTPVTPNTRATTYTRSLHPTASPQVTELPTRPFETTPGPPITTPSTGHATSSTGAGTRASVSTGMPEPSTSSLGTTLGSSVATSTATVSSQKTHTSSTPLVTTSPETRSTACQPRCAWTDWLDQSYPMPGASGGDFETYANIQAAGGAICQQPLQLQCRAEALPEEALQDLGQVVQCRLEEGLVCRNRDQSSLMCLNYQIRVLCCDHSHCPSPASPTSTTPAPSPSTISTSTGSLSSKVTTQTHLSSPGTIKRVSTPTTLTGPSSTGTTEGVSTPTRVTGPSSTGTTQSISSTPTRVTGPFSTGTTQSISSTTRMTGPSSTGTTKKVYTSTSVTGPFSTGTTKRVYATTSVTGPSSTGTRQSVYTSTRVTGPFSTGTTQRVSSPTTLTGPSSTGTTQRVSTPTRVTGPSSTGTTQSISSTPTRVTGPFSTGTIQSISSTTRMTGPSSTGTTKKVYTSTSVTGPFSTGTTKRVYATTSVTGPSSTGTRQSVYTSTRVTGPFSTGTTQRVSSPTTLTGPSSTGTTQRVSTPTRMTGPFSTGTTKRVYASTSVTGPSSVGTTQSVYTSTSVTGPFSPGTTESISTPSPSAFPGSPPMTTKPGLPSVSPTGPLLTSPISTASWSPPTTSSWSGVASGSPGTFSISTASPSPTTACLCHAFGKFFLPGDIIYNKTDGAGCHFLAICNQRCDIDRFQGACSTPSPSGTSASVPPDTPVPGCDRTIPPRQVNESWTLEDCTVARCEGDNRVVLLGPKPMGDVVCVNGHLPVRVQSGDGPCDYSYECECSCSGWGDTHYETFDGTSYSFLDNCTHVLMREIRPRHGNLSILLYNHYCEAAASCPRALGVHYESMDIVLTTTPGADGQEESLILFGQMRVRQSFSKNGLTVTATGATEMSIEIPAVGVRVIFNGRVFQAQLSYSHFSYNTEGQCGTCTNSRRDDCRRPDGTTAPTCQDMARSWLVPNSSGEGCWAPTGLPPTASPLSPAPSTPTSTPCPPEPLCELLLSPVFAGCHGLVPPGPFFSTCVSDSCGPSRPEALCQSLEAYSALCRARGVCPDWRNATSGLCDLTCPPTKVYRPCGPVQPKSCDSRSQSPASRGLAEGCFCPDGHILFNSHTDVCVPECPCVGPDGFPKFPGERWVSNCQSCVCDEGSVSVQCVPVQCEARDQPQECGWAGFVAQTRPLADNPCCMETLCVCNTSTCPQSPPKCRPGEELACTQAENSCCPTFSCRPQLCTYNGTVYGVGATFPAVIPCHTCTCLSVDTRDPTVQCEEEACNATCPQGFQYSRVAGQCCGECVQTACLTSDGRLVQPNETWVNSLVDNCTLYHCQAENGPPTLTPTPVACPDVSSCRGILRKIGCCYSCEEVDSCQVRASMTVLRHRGCATQAAVSVPFCEGFCPGASRYSTGARATQCPCVCCQETRAHQEVVTMQCPNGTAFQHTYTHVDECSCGPSCVSSAQAPEDSTPTFPIYGSTAV